MGNSPSMGSKCKELFNKCQWIFSPHQNVLGKNIKIQSIYVDQPSVDLPENEIVIETLECVTGQAFITKDSSHKSKLAL